MCSLKHDRLVVAVVAILAGTSPLAAQADTTGSADGAPAGGTAAGVSIERLMIPDENEGLTLAALHVTQLRSRSGAGIDFTLAVPPQAIAEGCFVGLGDIGPALAAHGPGGALLVRAGVSVVAAACGDGGGATIPGGYAGVSGLLRTGPRSAIRIDVAPHIVLTGDRPFTVLMVGVGITSLPGLRGGWSR